MRQSVKPKGVCSKRIDIEIEDGLIWRVDFEGGCHGNLQGLARLAEGREPKEVIRLLKGIKCGDKKTSCPDQLARALKKSLEKK